MAFIFVSSSWYFLIALIFGASGVWADLKSVFFLHGDKHSLRMLEVGNLNTEYPCFRISLNPEIAKECPKSCCSTILFVIYVCFFACYLASSLFSSSRGTKSTTTIAASNQFCCCWSGTSGGTCTRRNVPKFMALKIIEIWWCYINYT